MLRRLLAGIGGLVGRSWLYRWLTAEPEPAVVVIDLRETRTVGPLVGVLDRFVRGLGRELPSVTRGATVTRLLNWAEARARDRPIRVLSVAVAIVVNVRLLSLLGGDADPVRPATLFSFALLLLAVRGFWSTTSWAELAATDWYQRSRAAVIAALEPPPLPEPDGEDRSGRQPPEDGSAEPVEPGDAPPSGTDR